MAHPIDGLQAYPYGKGDSNCDFVCFTQVVDMDERRPGKYSTICEFICMFTKTKLIHTDVGRIARINVRNKTQNVRSCGSFAKQSFDKFEWNCVSCFK